MSLSHWLSTAWCIGSPRLASGRLFYHEASHNENAEVSKISRKVGLQSDSQCCESKKMIDSLHSENALLSLKMIELEEKYLAIVDKI